MFLDFDLLKKEMIGAEVDKPTGGTLSGHAAGEPFDKLANQYILKQYPDNTFRQYQYLNKLFLNHPEATTRDERFLLFPSSVAAMLLDRGAQQDATWSPDHLFEEKQNDTADILIEKDGIIEIIDVKTKNLDKDAQAPNIISAFKLAKACSTMIFSNEFDKLDINYLQVDWSLVDNKLVCRDLYFAELFKSDPDCLYINWAAAMQIQFHVDQLSQDYSGSRKDWAYHYLERFSKDARRRADDMIKKFAVPFENAIKKRD